MFNFFYRKQEGRCLSNFWECNIQIKDDEVREYESGECCFHGEKFIRVGKECKDEQRKKELIDYGKTFLKGNGIVNGNVVKKRGRALMLTSDELETWYYESIDVQTEICKYKYDHYEEVRNELIKSKGKILIHPAMRCNEEKVKRKLWEGKGIVVDGKIKVIGMNLLGKLWMNVRDEYI